VKKGQFMEKLSGETAQGTIGGLKDGKFSR
jgi:hypothetical protein